LELTLDERLIAAGLAERDLERVREAVSDPACLEAFADLARQGPYPARQLVREPEWLDFVVADLDHPRSVSDVVGGIERELGEEPTLDALYRTLRRAKRRESLRIFLREIRGEVSMRQTTAEIADLAEACLDVAVGRLAQLRGEPLMAQEFCVLGMGKLGGRELNFSSDVDLVYVCSNRAMTDDDFRVRAADFARALTDVMAATTEDGYVFRVDLRLRPDGSQGPIVQPRQAMSDYYEVFGRTWERSAWMKARPVAGERRLGDGVLDDLEPFVFRRYLDYGAIEELRAMKEKIEANAQLVAVVGEEDEAGSEEVDEARAPLADRLRSRMRGHRRRRRRPTAKRKTVPDEDRAGVLGWDVKIGHGGIREIEFFVQALQLVHCGTQPRLRVRNTLDALDALVWAGLVTSDDQAALADAYDFLRRLEHRIQMENDRQYHRLPRTWAHFDRIAGALDLGRDELRNRVLRHRQEVRSKFERLFSGERPTEGGPTIAADTPESLSLIQRAGVEQLGGPAAREALSNLGFERPRQVAGQLQVLREKNWGPFREDAWGPDLELAVRLIKEAAAAPDPDQAFSHLSRFVQAVGDRPGYYSMLLDNPHATRLLLQVFGSSAYLSGALIRDPNVFERLLAVGSVALEKSRPTMARELSERLEGIEDPEHRIGVIRRFHREETLRIALHETGAAARIEQSMTQLSLLAEVIIEQTLTEVYQPLRTRRRRPGSVLPELDEIPFTVVAMGKLGGRELGFGSDLDVVFVYENLRQWKLEHTFYARLAQRLIRTLTTASVEGKMYEVDTRLRPSGSQGALVVSLDAFGEYHRESAGTWERQALIRARPIAGPVELRRAVMDVRSEQVFGIDAEDPREEISAMRDRIRQAHYEHGTTDVKFGPGGLIDLEFGVQALQLMLGARTNEDVGVGDEVDGGLRSQSTRVAIRALAELDLPIPALQGLEWDYLTLCRVQARLRMAREASNSVVPDEPSELEAVARRTGHQGDTAVRSFTRELDAAMERVRLFWEQLVNADFS
jgi:glutamate-ammonia-ligase adenylyltransferase